MKPSRFWLLTALSLVVLVGALAPAVVLADDDPPPTVPSDDEVNAIAKNMYCPVCENIPLDACGTEACAQWREEIRDKLADGWTEEQIHEYFVERFGDRVLAEPPRRGLNWLVYILPPVAFVAGAVVLFLGFRRWRKPVELVVAEAPDVEHEDEYFSRLEEELKKRQ